jgi:hypothetical protein
MAEASETIAARFGKILGRSGTSVLEVLLITDTQRLIGKTKEGDRERYFVLETPSPSDRIKEVVLLGENGGEVSRFTCSDASIEVCLARGQYKRG